ncbi:MAG: hypothetical protein GWN71_25220, partial [Gammaproteobacteria bacterium]|nr:hypothetical protein [Gemmatimonadota bacterium]NIT96810.1 hypothetical protein [Actinomycetota bacterium]NIU76742.1 hypothetical protein [Gammaproteobacteria bacterium]NIV88506.1 hypothetical protein [Actinomycetota bacterium]NIX51793.1 hypothetical protein [Actinomycetota bacterium]
VLLTAVALGGFEIAGRIRAFRLDRVALGCGVLWVVAYTSVTAGRIADGWPTAGYRLRADRLAASVEAL